MRLFGYEIVDGEDYDELIELKNNLKESIDRHKGHNKTLEERIKDVEANRDAISSNYDELKKTHKNVCSDLDAQVLYNKKLESDLRDAKKGIAVDRGPKSKVTVTEVLGGGNKVENKPTGKPIPKRKPNTNRRKSPKKS